MDLRSDSPFWLLNSGVIKTYPSLSSDQKTDIVIIGAGITGALVAWHLCKAGFDVIVVDKRHVGMGSTAASTALLQYEIDTPLTTLSKLVGEKNAVKSYQLCIQSIFDLQKICKNLGKDAEFEMKESFQYASSQKDSLKLMEEYKLRKKHGIDLRWLTGKDIERKFGFEAPGGVLSAIGATVDSYKLCHALLARSATSGLKLFDNTEVVNIVHKRKGVAVETRNGFIINASHLVIACGYESQRYIPKKIEELNSTYAIISERMPDQKDFWYKNALIWETATPYLYLRTTKDKRIIVGGKDDKTSNPNKRDNALPRKAKALEKSFAKLFPQYDFRTDFRWAGTFGETKDGLPYIGSISQRPNTSFALGFGGNGITFSVIAAQVITEKLRGKANPHEAIFGFNR